MQRALAKESILQIANSFANTESLRATFFAAEPGAPDSPVM
jgi:hypothetical protein